jgi:hypothetical protein
VEGEQEEALEGRGRELRRSALTLLIVGSVASAVAIALAIAWNWFFRGEAGIARGTIVRLVLLSFLVAAMPLGLLWARKDR